ncbi:MAG: PsbP-related protein [Eubacteriales bacterium]
MKGRIVVLAKRKLIFTVVLLLGVMCPLLMASYRAPVDEVTGQGIKMLNYSSEKEGITFKYPQGWSLRSEKDYTGGEIIESVSFASPDQAAHGFVQIMRLAKPIPEYIRDAEKSMAPGFDSLEFKQTVSGQKQGFVLFYKRGSGDARNVASEYFFKNQDKVYRFSYFYPEGIADQYSKVFEDMLESFTLPGESGGLKDGQKSEAGKIPKS